VKGLLRYFQDVLKDNETNSYSSKRFVTIFCVFLIAVGYIANLFGNFTVEQFMFESLMYIVIAGLGISGAERFAPTKKVDA